MVMVGRVARAHGLRGDVIVNPDTDFVEERFRRGAVVWTRSARGDEPLTIAASRIHGGRPVLTFEGVASIEAAEEMAGQELRVPEEALQPLSQGSYYWHQLVGCAVETVSGTRIGDVARVEGGASGSLLAIDGARGEILIPLAADICVAIDVTAKRITIDPPEGLLELNEVGRRHDLSADGRGGSRGRGRQPGN